MSAPVGRHAGRLAARPNGRAQLRILSGLIAIGLCVTQAENVSAPSIILTLDWNARFIGRKPWDKRLAMHSVAPRIVGLTLLSMSVIYSSAGGVPDMTMIVATTAIAASESESGISGEVIIRPVRPHATIGEQNLEPYQATVEVIDPNGRPVASIQSDPEGKFRIGLPPGTYTLRPQSSGSYPRASTQTVVVEPRNFTQVRIIYDTGIR
jgi:Carboxypeptidase regulatory-like domain